jgi:hypothetical protein
MSFVTLRGDRVPLELDRPTQTGARLRPGVSTHRARMDLLDV